MSELKRTQMYFPEDVLRELKKRAKENRTTIAEIVRNAVSGFIKQGEKKNWTNDTLWDMVGSSSSREGDLSVGHDKYLYGKNK